MKGRKASMQSQHKGTRVRLNIRLADGKYHSASGAIATVQTNRFGGFLVELEKAHNVHRAGEQLTVRLQDMKKLASW